MYEETLEDNGRFNEQPVLPFNAYGTMAMARSEFEANDGSSQFFFLLKVRNTQHMRFRSRHLQLGHRSGNLQGGMLRSHSHTKHSYFCASAELKHNVQLQTKHNSDSESTCTQNPVAHSIFTMGDHAGERADADGQ